jgi:hypothetical protein
MKNQSQDTDKKPSVLVLVQMRNMPPLVRLQLFVRACGRCEFDGCNKYLLEHPVTLTEGNFAEIAHVVAFKPDGPRGKEGARPEDINDVSNLMLLCPQCHKLIDDHPERFSRQTLEEYKQRHENRIYHVTGLGPGLKTSVLVVRTSIGEQTVAFPYDQIIEAISPRYPISRQGTQIDLTQLHGEGLAFFEVAQNTIDQRVGRMFEPGGEVEQAGHISLFALAPIPLLILLGKHLSNKVPLDIYQRHRDTENWTWKKDGRPVAYEFRQLQSSANGTPVALVLSLSGAIPTTALVASIGNTATIYEITLRGTNPSATFLRLRQDLENFRIVYQEALGTIIKNHGLVEVIDLFPAVPAPVAVLCGRELLSKVHPRLRVHDYNKNTGGFTFALEV